MDYINIIKEIQSFSDEIAKLKGQLREAFIKAIDECGEENPFKVTQISERCFTIKFSSVMGRPWSPSFYDFKASGTILKEYLEKKPFEKWLDEIKSLYNKCSSNVVYIPK